MATALLSIYEEEEQECYEEEEKESLEPERESICEDTLQGARRVLEIQRKQVEAEIENAQRILHQPKIEGDGDVYSEDTLNRAVAFMKAHIEWVWRSFGTKAPVPAIGPGPRGSVDLYWKRPSWELLVNIPASLGDLGTFYGRDDHQQKAKGSFDPGKLTLSIATWMTM